MQQSQKSVLKRVIIFILIAGIIAAGVFCYIKFKPKGDIYVDLSGSTYTLNWETAENAQSYQVYLDNELIATTNDKENSLDVTKYLIDDGNYNFVIKYTDIDQTEKELYTYKYNYRAYVANDFKRKSFFMNGNIYDYYIESPDEYEIFVWYNILYRNNNIRCYIATNEINITNLNALTRQAIYDYPEYDAVSYASSYAKLSGKIATLTNFKYYLPKDFTLSTATVTATDNYQLYKYVQHHEQYTKETNFNVEYERASDYGETRNLPIDQREREVLVYNTEQLFMVVQYGAKPKFADENSVAATVYKNARQVLAEINSDSLTDYQKALNIYRYLCMNVTYDHVLLDYMEAVNDYTVTSFGMFDVFYLEGVLYDLDNQVAVCDGIAKSFSLLCQMEGITATKINGEAGTGTSKGLHAWNRIELDGEWYLADCTWGVASYAVQESLDYKMYEAFTHSYFLVSEDEISDTHTPTYQVSNEQTTSYDFYRNTTISTKASEIKTSFNIRVGSKNVSVSTDDNGNISLSLYIDSDEDLAKLKLYMRFEGRKAIDVKFDESYLYSISPTLDANEITNYLKSYNYVDGYTITGWMNYSLNVFLIMGTSISINA